ncbi:MAG: hypothetical protein IPN96_16615 [Anaerolineales bacterium]|nr:hypothetical protein [Anaerolineales bacterium]
MLKKNTPILLSTIKSYAGNNSLQILCYVVILIIAATTFIFQSKVIGLEGGYDDQQPNHHGWVTANTLAIISKATPENYFVGYALASRDDQNNFHYEYFDRYPVFFSAVFNRILSLSDTLAEKLHLARQVMDFIFLGTLILAFLIVDKLINNKPLSLAIALLVFSNPYLLWYKDMVHFDQPALFGFLLLIYALALYKFDGVKTLLYVSTFIAIGLGRGYASYSILMLWLAFEAFMILKIKGVDIKEKVRSIFRHPAFLLVVLAIAWGGSLLTYNVIIEAHTRNVSIVQTSILQSARYRLSLNPKFNQENEDVINFPSFVESQVNRIIQWSFPVKEMPMGYAGNLFLLGIMIAAIGITIWKQTADRRMIYLILTLSGFVWLFPLRNLAAFHDYTAMYYIGIPLVFFISIFTTLNSSKIVSTLLLIAGLAIYISNVVQTRDWHENNAGQADAYVYDLDHILEKIDGKGNNVNMAEVIPYGPFPPGFYFSEQYLSSKNAADYIVSRNRNLLPNNLTPDNKIIFLFEK